MDRIERIEKQMEREFKDHIVEKQTYAGITIVDFFKPGTIISSLRFIFDGEIIHISGDYGVASFICTWNVSPYDWQNKNYGYLCGKLRAIEGDMKTFNPDLIIEEISNLRDEFISECNEFNMDILDDGLKFFERFEKEAELDSKYHWSKYIEENHDEVCEYISCDYWEFLFDCGDEINSKAIIYIAALKRIEQILLETENN